MTDLSVKDPVAQRIPDTAGAVFAPVSPCDLAAQGVTKSFSGKPVFADVSFRLARGEAVALVGANGTGKSTLLRCLIGLLPLTRGEVTLLGTTLGTASRGELRQLRGTMGLVSQKHNLVPRLSVLSNVLHGMLGQRSGPRYWSQSLAPADLREAGMQALARVGLADLAQRRADRLSGGQSQRVAIARALIGKPRLLIADEPCASLDPAAGEDVMDLFFRLVRDEGVTVVFTSHNVDHALRYGDRVLGLANGRLKLDATAASLSAEGLRGLYD